MSNAQIAQKIKDRCKEKNISVAKLLSESGIRKSLIYDLEKRDYTPSVTIVEEIASYLDCSVDYLLGRTNTPEENIINNNSTINGGVQAIKSPVTVNAKENTDSNDIMNQFMQAFSELPFENKVAALNFVLDMKRSA